MVQTTAKWYAPGVRPRRRIHARRARSVVTLSSSVSSPGPDQPVRLSGSVAPGHAGERVLIEERVSGGWRVVARPRRPTGSRYALWRAFGPGVHRLRAVFAGDERNLRTSSRIVSVARLTGIHKIRHVVIIMQENRSFDSYFGTYPGADGIPHRTCVPDPMHRGCVRPFHDSADSNFGGPHAAGNARADIDGGLMDGFVAQADGGGSCGSVDPNCSPCHQNHVGQP